MFRVYCLIRIAGSIMSRLKDLNEVSHNFSNCRLKHCHAVQVAVIHIGTRLTPRHVAVTVQSPQVPHVSFQNIASFR